MKKDIVILAAGQGKRMCSKLPKVLHPVAGRSMLSHVVALAKQLQPETIHVVYGHQGYQVKQSMADESLHWVNQPQRLGTGDAVKQAVMDIPADRQVLVLYADVPLLRLQTLQSLIDLGQQADLCLLTAMFDDPTGFGRILFDYQGHPVGIVEQKDANPVQQQLKEINTGVMFFAQAGHLQQWLPALAADNAQGELYLTDVVAMAVEQSLKVRHQCVVDAQEVMGVNDRVQLAKVERAYQCRCLDDLMRSGVTVYDPNRVEIRGHLSCQQDVVIDVNVVFEGDVTLGEGVVIGSHCVIKNSSLDNGVVVHPHSVIDGATIGVEAEVGPFARLRPGTVMEEGSKVGNFVEVKQARLGKGTKASHLSYIGDAMVGPKVNIGAGTITCNYDGVRKHRTIIEEGAFIGSGTQLVAPIHIGKYATLGAGTTLRKDAPAESLTVSEVSQKVYTNWRRPR